MTLGSLAGLEYRPVSDQWRGKFSLWVFHISSELLEYLALLVLTRIENL